MNKKHLIAIGGAAKGITTIKFGNGEVRTPENLSYSDALDWANYVAEQRKTWFTYSVTEKVYTA